MQKWEGAAALCMNENNELLMVLQGKPEEENKWSIPSGGKEANESFEACCLREFEEETGYQGEIIKEIKTKYGIHDELLLSLEVRYYLVKIIGGVKTIQDPDQLIHEIAWRTAEDIENIKLTYPEDRAFLLQMLKR